MSESLPSVEKDAGLKRRVCLECGTKWSAINDPVNSVPIECPECGGDSAEDKPRSTEGACTCSPYFGCSEYAPDCERHGIATQEANR